MLVTSVKSQSSAGITPADFITSLIQEFGQVRGGNVSRRWKDLWLGVAPILRRAHGASGTNAAIIRGALRAEKPELLIVILPQSLKKQPPESQELLSKVQNVIEKPYNDQLPLLEASRLGPMNAEYKERNVGS